MRIALITLALAALAFIGSIIYSMTGKGDLLSAVKTNQQKETDTSVAIETLKYQIKTDAKIDELTKKIEELSQNKTNEPRNTWGIVSSEKTNTTTGSVTKTIPISGKLLAKIMPTFNFTLIENNGIFDLHIFDTSISYSTYTDEKLGTTIIASTMPYATFLTNMKWLWDDVYVVNETKTFPFRSFYINPAKPDTLVRLVIEVESQAIAIQIPKTKFKTLKDLLLKK